ncbi:MAG TPA: efflux RND transporter permease subunit, partial [Armatimonadetes bacterium]|nr:efflux RND transporter permease subunit [Armatimonadota bacterium]
SFTFTPMLASRWFKRLTRADLERPPRTSLERSFAAFDRLWRQFDVVYRTALEWALDNRTLVMFIGFGSLLTIVGFSAPPILRVRLIIAGIILGACIIAALIAKGQRTGLIAFGIICTILLATVHVPAKFSFIPRTDAGKLFVSIEMPPGTSMTQTDRLVRRVERKLMQLPEVKHVVTSVGTMGEAVRAAGSYGPEYASLLVVLVDKMKRRRSQEEIAQWIDDWARREIPEAFVGVEEQSGSAHRGAPIRLEIIGRNRSELIALANMIAERINRVNGIRDIRISWRTGRPEFQAHIDRYKAADLGFSAADVAWVLRTAIEGNTDLKFKEDTHEYDIRIRLSRDSLRTREDLMNLIIGTGFGQQPVRLRELASMIEGIGPTRLERKDREPMIAITANLRPGAHLGNVQREIQKALADIDPGANRIYFGGDIELMRENFRHLFSALALSVILVYMLQAALFNSFLLPFSIMLSLPQALVGALAALMITDKGLSIVAMIGIIMLMGVVNKNAILLVDFTNTLRARGLSLRDAVVRAGETRLRPILMTTLTLWFAVLPTALEIGRGTELRSPMAIAVLGGLTLSTLLTLLVVPVAYTIFEDVAHAIVRAWHRLIGKPSEA